MKTSWSDFGISCPSLSLFILCIWESTLGPVKKLAVNNNHFNSLDNRYLAHTSRLHQYTEGKNFFLWLTCFVFHRDFIRHNILNFVLKRRIVLHTDTHILVVRTVEYIARIDILFTCSSHSINYGRFAWLLLKRIAQITNNKPYLLLDSKATDAIQSNRIESSCVFF